MDTENEKIRLGISSCLLGNLVRYDGGHKHDRFITDTLGAYVEYVPVCPEVECGMPAPREALRLVGDPAEPRLVTVHTGKDFTGQMKRWARSRLDELEKEDLCGYIFKSKSPSSGMQRIKVYNEQSGIPVHTGVGIFARMFMDRFPLLPVEDEGRLHDPRLRENFIESLFVFKRWRGLASGRKSAGALVDFHTRHKLLIMSHSQQHYREMGKLVSRIKSEGPARTCSRYEAMLMHALSLLPTVKKHTNVLYHLMGYFKTMLSTDEKQELLEVIERYHKNLVPLIVPLTLIQHYVRKYQEPYLLQQHYLQPHPIELQLRNHV
jgi:uncharacterized protein YbgA (DUF1722 family)/uncharacterized protein YbbK (DUF523 family)